MNFTWSHTIGTLVGPALIIGGFSADGQEDYLAPELRVQVEDLKIESTANPTDATNVLARAPVVWEWMNGLANRGERFLIDLPLWLSYPLGTPEEPILPMAIRGIDNAIRELQIKDENENAVGTFSVDASSPFVVNSHQTFRQTYTVGSVPMAEGGGLLVTHQLMADYGVPQTNKPAESDYVSIACSNPKASFRLGRHRIPSFIHGVYPGTPLSFTLQGTSLEPGETISITFGDRSEGSPGFLIQSSENDEFMIPIYVDLEGNQNYFTAHWPGMKVVGGPGTGVTVIGPSIVGVGESFDVALRTHDAYYNRATSDIPAYQVTMNGKEVLRTLSGRGLTVIEDLRISEEGVYRIDASSEDGGMVAKSNPLWVRQDPAHRIFWGETHGHTSYAEGQGTVANYFRYGREDARLDFIALSEHDAWMDDYEWTTLIDAVDQFSDPGAFSVFLSFEWTGRVQFGGHHNVLYRTAADRTRTPVQTAGSLSRLIYGLRDSNEVDDVLVIPHAHMPGDWRQNDPQLGRLVEITSMHGTFEWFGNYYLQHGHQVGFVGASDNHEGRPGFSGDSRTGAFQHFGGLAAVMAEELSDDTIFDSMRRIDAYATSDAARIILDASMNGAPMGKRMKFSANRKLDVSVLGTSPVDYIDVIKNGEIVHTKRFLGEKLTDHCWVNLSFESISENGLRDSPRGDRIWKGRIRVSNATLESVSIPGLHNPYVEYAAIDPEDPTSISFHNETRGRSNVILIELSGASANTVLEVELDATREHGITYPIVYRPSVFPKRTLALPLADAALGQLAKLPQVEGAYTDQVTFELVSPDEAYDRRFSYEEMAQTHGDYYYVRVTQLDGARAWSSPWWVGGDPPR